MRLEQKPLTSWCGKDTSDICEAPHEILEHAEWQIFFKSRKRSEQYRSKMHNYPIFIDVIPDMVISWLNWGGRTQIRKIVFSVNKKFSQA